MSTRKNCHRCNPLRFILGLRCVSGASKKEILGVDVAMIEVPTALEDLISEGLGVGISVSHSFQGFDLVIESLADRGGESGGDVGLDVVAVLGDGASKALEGFESRLSDEQVPVEESLSERNQVGFFQSKVKGLYEKHCGVDIVIELPETSEHFQFCLGALPISLDEDESATGREHAFEEVILFVPRFFEFLSSHLIEGFVELLDEMKAVDTDFSIGALFLGYSDERVMHIETKSLDDEFLFGRKNGECFC